MIQHLNHNYIDTLEISLKEQPAYYLEDKMQLDRKSRYYDIKRYLEDEWYPKDATDNKKKRQNGQ